MIRSGSGAYISTTSGSHTNSGSDSNNTVTKGV